MLSETLKSVLAELNGTSAEIEASAIISIDGLMMASMLPQGLDEDRIGAPWRRSSIRPWRTLR